MADVCSDPEYDKLTDEEKANLERFGDMPVMMDSINISDKAMNKQLVKQGLVRHDIMPVEREAKPGFKLNDEEKVNLGQFSDIPVVNASINGSDMPVMIKPQVKLSMVRHDLMPVERESTTGSKPTGKEKTDFVRYLSIDKSDEPKIKQQVGQCIKREDIHVEHESTPDKPNIDVVRPQKPNSLEGEKLLNPDERETEDHVQVGSKSCCCFEIRRGMKAESWPPKFCYRDLFIGFVSFLTFGFDYGTDVRLMIEYISYGEYTLFALTCGFIVVPSFISGVISVIWYKMTYRRDKLRGYGRAKMLYYTRICLSFVQLGRIFRQGEYLYNVLHSLREEKKGGGNDKDSVKYRIRAMEEKRDAAILGLIDGFMESALQLILQLYLSINLGLPATFPRVSSLVSSWLSTSLMVTTYYRANRKAVKDAQNVDYFSSLFYLFWKITELGPRYLFLTLALVFFQPYCFACFPLHVIFVYILFMKFKPDLSGLCTMPESGDKTENMNMLTLESGADESMQNDENAKNDRCSFSRFLQHLFVLVMSFIGIFTYINLKDRETRIITSIYYAVYYAENIIIAALFLYFSVSTDMITIWTYTLFALPAGILCHTLFSGLYYGCFHPNKWNKDAPSITVHCCC